MVDFPETMDKGTILSPPKYHIVTGSNKTKAGKISSINISKYDIPLTLLSKKEKS